MGRQASAASEAALAAFGSIWVCTEIFSVDYVWMYLTAGGGHDPNRSGYVVAVRNSVRWAS